MDGKTGGGSAGAAGETSVRTVFAGLMLGMLLAAVAQTIIAPAMPRIVAELGGMEHYSWIAVSALLASTVIVPVVGKLSDLYGRKAFYVAGIGVFMASSLVAGLAGSFGTFMVARVLEGLGMGTMMPLSQAIIGDLVPPRERGKYQGLMGGVFGLASIVGPFVGGAITDHLGWRWLFFVNIPVGLVALGFIVPFMRLGHERRPHRIDYAGFVTLSVGLTCALLATVWGGTEHPWGSPTIVGLYAVGAASLALFVWVETRAPEPVLPLRLWRNGIFTAANVANMAVAMAMFGAIYFIPVYVQGVMGRSVTGSGAVLTPMMLSMVAMSALSGQVISRTGRYKAPVLLGIALMAAGLFLLARMDRSTSYGALVRNMAFVGLGLGTAMPTFVLVVQNAVAREDLGVATAATQLFRSIGSSVGIAVLGTIMSTRLAAELERLAAGGAGAALPAGAAGEGAGAVLNPELMRHLPPAVLEAFREALAAALHPVFVATVPIAGVAFAAALLLREIPLRRTTGAEAAEAGKEILAGLNQAGEGDEEPVLGRPNPAYESRAAFLGLVFGLLAHEADRGGRARLGELLARMGEGDRELGRRRLDAVAGALLRECAGDGEEGASPVQAALSGGSVRPASLEPRSEFERALADSPGELRERLRALVTGGAGRSPAAVLTPADLETLERIGVAASAALLLDLRGENGGRGNGSGDAA
ncbi:MAG TPA: MDR family MFS transporter [Longimicrobium sp.]|jgi:EmrB/QacA subfamily drug resistance transporter